MDKNGFTLVELAIVLMIIGLLIGGILRGQEMMENARITSTIQQIKAYQGAYVTFQDKYNAVPGDMALTTARLTGCQAGNSNQCQNGNGDGLIGVQDNGVLDMPYNDVSNAVTSENNQAWKHLALAHLISGVDPSAVIAEWGKTHPVAGTGGGFFLRYGTIRDPATMTATGNFLLLRGTISGLWTCGMNNNGACAISPKRGSQLDRKMDDGIATTGNALAVSASWISGCGPSNPGVNGLNGYAESNDIKNCEMMFKID